MKHLSIPNVPTLSSPPSGTSGDVMVDSTEQVLKYHNGVAWLAAGAPAVSDTVPALTWDQVKNGVTLTTRVLPPLTWGDVRYGITI